MIQKRIKKSTKTCRLQGVEVIIDGRKIVLDKKKSNAIKRIAMRRPEWEKYLEARWRFATDKESIWVLGSEDLAKSLCRVVKDATHTKTLRPADRGFKAAKSFLDLDDFKKVNSIKTCIYKGEKLFYVENYD